MDPIIVTLGLDDATQARLDALRRLHFPPERNLVPAHTTLFHKLPGADVERVIATAAALAAATPVFTVDFPHLTRLSTGVAIAVDAPELLTLRAGLAESFAAELTPQDRQPYKPHVTIMNKATPRAAVATFNQLMQGWTPFAGEAKSILLWHCRGGPWELARALPLAGSAQSGEQSGG